MAQYLSEFLNTSFSTFTENDAFNNSVRYPITLTHTTTGIPGVGIGTGLKFVTETSNGNNEIGGVIDVVTTDVSSSSEDFDFVFKNMAAGSAVTETLRIASAGDLTVANNLTVSGGNITLAASSSRDKYRLWSNSTYAIGLQDSVTFGAINNDKALTCQVSNSNNQGFWWGDSSHTTAQGAMALSTDGKLTVAHSLRLGYGESDTTTPGITFPVEVNGIISSSGLDIGESEIIPATGFVAWSYDSNNFDCSNEDNIPVGVAVQPSGGFFFMVGQQFSSVYKYAITTPLNVSSLNYITSFNLGSEDTVPTDITFKNSDGTEMYITGLDNSSVYQYTLGTAWDIDTASYTDSYDVSTQDTEPYSIEFKTDGLKMYVGGRQNNSVYEYTLSVAWDVTSATLTNTYALNINNVGLIDAIRFTSDGSVLYILCSRYNSIVKYTLSVAWNISTATFSDSVSIQGAGTYNVTDPTGLTFLLGQDRAYISDKTLDRFFEYDLSTVAAKFSGDRLIVNSSLHVDETLIGYGNAQINGNMDVARNFSVDGTALITGSLTVDGNILTNQLTIDVVDTNAITVNIAGAATTLNFGYNGPNASTTNISTGAVDLSTTKTVNIGTGGAASSTTNVNIGSNAGGTTTINSSTVVGSSTTQNIFNTTATTVNFAGASTALTIGATSGTATIRNSNVILSGDLEVRGGDLTTNQTTFNLLNSTATTINLGGAATVISVGSGTGTTTVNHNLTVTGDLTVNGTTTTVNSTTISIDDKNIELGSVATPSDTTADGGGITLKGTTDKTIIWDNANDNWTSSEHWNLASGKEFKINNVSMINSTTLGSTVVTSSLTTVGTIGSGIWQGTIINPTYGGTGINNGSKTITLGGNFTHTGAHTLGLTTTGNTSITLPTSGTVATTGNLSQFASTTSAELAGVISDETGSGALVFANTPTLVTPVLGVATATSINKVAITAPTTGSTLTIADGKTLTASNTLTFTGTDSSSVAFGAGGTVAYIANKLSVFAATTSAELAGVISDETGSGALVFGTSPTFTTGIVAGSATMALFNTTATTVNAFGATTTLNLGYDSTAASTTNISTGAVAASTIKTVNLGTGGAASSTTNINIGASVGGTTTISSPNITISGLGDTATAATHYYVETGSTGNLLPKTLANVRTEIVTTAAVNAAAATTVGTITSGVWNAGAVSSTGAFTSTLTGVTTTGGGQLYLNGATSNRIDFNTNGVAIPAFSTRSAGTKVVYYPSVGAAAVDYAVGISTSTLWHSVPTTAEVFRWYGGTTQSAELTGAGTFTATGDVCAYSDIRLKDNIELIADPLDKVLKLRGVTYTRTDLDDNKTHMGVIAQEVEEIIPEVVITNEDGIKTVAYGNVVGLLIEAIKELTVQNKALLARVERLENKN